MRIWINQSFSLRNAVVAMMADRPTLDLCISAVNAESPVSRVAPTFWSEPERTKGGYVDWTLSTAIEHGVQAFIPQRQRNAISAAADRFREAGIEMHVAGTPRVLDLLDDKAAFALDLGDDPVVPRTIRVMTSNQFVDAVTEIERAGLKACVKPSRGIYGAGYWTLDAPDPFAHLRDPDTRRIDAETFATSMRRAEKAGKTFDLVVMENLPGDECSVDIVADHGNVRVAAVRTKIDANRQRISTTHGMIRHAADLVSRYELHGAVNVQYKTDQTGEWRILEINTRIAGGASYCDAAGIPYSASWIDVVLGAPARDIPRIDMEVDTVTFAVPREDSRSGR